MLSIIKKIKYSTIALSFVFVVSCNLADPLKNETREVDFINKTGDIIKGKTLDLDVPGCKSIAVYDTLLMVLTNNRDALLQVYNTKSLKPLAMLCHQGRAKNEFSDGYIYSFNQILKRNGDVLIVLRGEGGSVLKEVNVSASIREGHTVIEGVNDNIPAGNDIVIGLNNGINRLFSFNNHNYNLDRETYDVPSFYINDKKTKNIKVYRRLVDFENDRYSTFWYSGSLCYNPYRNVVVQCMNSIDYIHFFDIDNDNYFSIHQTGTSTFKSIKIPNKIVDDVYVYDFNHFSESIGTEDFFLVIYMNGDYRKEKLKQGNGEATELLAFDWDGNYLGGVKLDIFVQDIAFDSLSNLLYGLRIRDEKIVTFDLSDFIKTIEK
ncbi:MAG: hypothetical protein IK038_09690 [Bacteroidaceae bacterium]|nr:hypothetical protein [Bacteroidaceae bacterium]